MEIKPWEILESKTAFENHWWKIVQETVKLPDGSVYSDYFVNHVKGVVVVLAVTEDGKVLVNRQYKHGVREIVLELTIGRYEEADSDGLEGAKRELLEETGYGGGTWEKLPGLVTNPSGSTARVHAFLARDVRKISEPMNDPKEVIEVTAMTPSELLRLSFAGEMTTTASLAVVLMAAKRLGWISENA